MKRPKPSITNAPSNNVDLPSPWLTTVQPAKINTRIASQPTTSPVRSSSVMNTPSISSAMAPIARISSG